jgi:hypothetical protein
MSWGANTVALLNENDQKGSNLLGTLGNPEGEAFDQNVFKLVGSAGSTIRADPSHIIFQVKTGILFLFILCLLQAAARAAASSYFEGNFKGVDNDEDGIETLFLVWNLLLYGVMLAGQLLWLQ